mmetsp:Transcript_84302/g.136646  ORF Transcript_84302/g.136646 Transcript_84302/m.136646 type:complete len:289 (-) Transcript_84302:2840-3706(-)
MLDSAAARLLPALLRALLLFTGPVAFGGLQPWRSVDVWCVSSSSRVSLNKTALAIKEDIGGPRLVHAFNVTILILGLQGAAKALVLDHLFAHLRHSFVIQLVPQAWCVPNNARSYWCACTAACHALGHGGCTHFGLLRRGLVQQRLPLSHLSMCCHISTVRFLPPVDETVVVARVDSLPAMYHQPLQLIDMRASCNRPGIKVIHLPPHIVTHIQRVSKLHFCVQFVRLHAPIIRHVVLKALQLHNQHLRQRCFLNKRRLPHRLLALCLFIPDAVVACHELLAKVLAHC